MTCSSPLKRLQSPTKTVSRILFHPQPSNDVCLRGSISILSDGSKGHADYSVFVGDFGDEVGVKGSNASIEDDHDFIARSHFTDCSNHQEISRGRGI